MDHFVCLLGAQQSLPNGTLDFETFIALPHILVAPFGMQQGAVDQVLAAKGVDRFVRLSVPDFQQITPELLDNRYVVTLPSWVARNLQDRTGNALAIHELPISISDVSYYALWHERFDKDAKSIWLRKHLKDILK